MGIFCSYQQKSKQNNSSNSWRCFNFLNLFFRNPHLFAGGFSQTPSFFRDPRVYGGRYPFLPCPSVKEHPSRWTFQHRMSLKCKATSMMSMATSTPRIWLTMTHGLAGWKIDGGIMAWSWCDVMFLLERTRELRVGLGRNSLKRCVWKHLRMERQVRHALFSLIDCVWKSWVFLWQKSNKISQLPSGFDCGFA